MPKFSHPDSKPLTPEMEKKLDTISKREKLKEAVRKDQWYNPTSGLGEFITPEAGGDRSSDNRIYWRRLAHIECERLYCGDKICRKIVEKVVKAAMRENFKLKLPDLDTEKSSKANKIFKVYAKHLHQLYEKIKKAAILGEALWFCLFAFKC